MTLVFKNMHGEILWEQKFEVESLEAFVQMRNRRVRETGSDRDLYFIESPRTVKEMDWNGKLSGTYHLCAADGYRLI